MNWITHFLTSSIGKKLIMSLTGLFLILFLVIHLIGNLQLLFPDNGQTFNLYAHTMTTNPFIKTVSWGLYFFILLHAVQGLLLAIKNKKSKGKKYAVNTNQNASWASKNMALLGILILAFILIHMGDFWFAMKYTDTLQMVTYDGIQVKDLHAKVMITFSQPIFVIGYIVGMIAMAFHLWHGFQSAFQTLGLNHKKYTPIIRGIGKFYAIVIPTAFAIIPIVMYLNK